MGTGVPLWQSPLIMVKGALYTLKIEHISFTKALERFWSSPRPISIGQLNTLLHLHLRPINHIVYVWPY